MLSGAALAQQTLPDPAEYLRLHVQIGVEIAQAEKDLAAFPDGLLKNMVSLRLETLRLNQAIIQTRLVGAQVAAPAAVPSVMPDPELATRIRAEIATLDLQIAATEREVAATTGAIVALPMTRLETDKVTRALLNGSLMRAEYGVIAPVFNEMVLPGPQKAEPSAGAAPAAAVEAPSEPQAAPAAVAEQPSEPVVTPKPATTDFSDPNYPGVDYSRPIFQEELPDAMSYSGWWAHGPVSEPQTYMLANFSNLITKDGLGEPALSVFCGPNFNRMLIFTGKVFNTGAKGTVEVTMTPDWRAPHTAVWSVEGSPQGDNIFSDGARAVLYMHDAKEVKFSIRDASGEPTELNFKADGLNPAMSAMFGEGGCKFDDSIWSRAEVKVIQERLNALGYDVGSADGAFGAKSRETLRRWQIDNKIPATGEIDFATVTALGFYQRAGELGAAGSAVGNF